MMRDAQTRDSIDDKEQMVERAGEGQVERRGGAYGPDPRWQEEQERQERERADEERER